MRALVIAVLALLMASSAYSANKGLNILYVQYDTSVDKQLLNERIKARIEEFKETDFAIYFANDGTILEGADYTEEGLGAKISNLGTEFNIAPQDELEKLSGLLNDKMKFCITTTDNGGKMIGSQNKYETMTIDLFVGKMFLGTDKKNSVIAKLIYSNSLEGIQMGMSFNLAVVFYVCGESFRKKDCKFNAYYNINNLEINE